MIKLGVIIVVIVAVAAALYLLKTDGVRAGRPDGDIQMPELYPGGVYSVLGGDGGYKAVKVLAVDEGGVHVRLYKNRYENRPSEQELGELELGTVHDEDGCGIGHMPVTAGQFVMWEPELVTKTELTEEELEGYNIWKEDGGGYWGE